MGSGVAKPSGDHHHTTRHSSTPHPPSTTSNPGPSTRRHTSPLPGNTRFQSPSQTQGPSTSSRQQVDTDDAEMVCETCQANFTIFKRKHRCTDCDKYYCANCIHKEPRKCCFTCRVFEGLMTRGDITKVKLKDLRQFLLARNISIETCREKNDLVDLVVQHLQLPTTPQILSSNSQTSSPAEQHRVSETSNTSSTSSGTTIPITEPNSSGSRPTNASQQTTSRPSVHIYGETPLGPMRPAWNEDSASDPSLDENSQGMEESEFPEIINIPNDRTAPPTTQSQGGETQQSQMTGEPQPHPAPADEAPTASSDNNQGIDSAVDETAAGRITADDEEEANPNMATSSNNEPGVVTIETDGDEPTVVHDDVIDNEGDSSVGEFPEIINIPQAENPEPAGTDGTPPQGTSTDPDGNDSDLEPSTERPAIRKQRASVSDLRSAMDISSLSIKQLKEILSRNFVDYKGCVERYELEERVKRLYNEKETFKQKEEKVAAESKDGKEGAATIDDIYDLDPELCCKICMDAPIDCVLLECGHMVTCSKCGKRLSECPICRQYVVRAVHVFKS